MKLDVKGKKLHAVVQGDKTRGSFYALIMNPSHTIMYKMTGKYKRFETLMNSVEKWAKENHASELSWDKELKKN
jgi:hypothetical protein